MTRFLFVVLFFCSSLMAGDDVDEFVEIVGVNDQNEFLVLEKWHVQGMENKDPFPMFFAIYRSFGQLQQFADISMLAGLKRSDLESWPPKAEKKWKELLAAFQAAGFENKGIEPLKFTTKNGYATILLPDGRMIEERGKPLKRKPNQLQEEDVSLWISEKGAKPVLLKDAAIRTVVRSFSNREIQKAYWLKDGHTVVALYNNPSQGASDRGADIWTHRFDGQK